MELDRLTDLVYECIVNGKTGNSMVTNGTCSDEEYKEFYSWMGEHGFPKASQRYKGSDSCGKWKEYKYSDVYTGTPNVTMQVTKDMLKEFVKSGDTHFGNFLQTSNSKCIAKERKRALKEAGNIVDINKTNTAKTDKDRADIFNTETNKDITTKTKSYNNPKSNNSKGLDENPLTSADKTRADIFNTETESYNNTKSNNSKGLDGNPLTSAYMSLEDVKTAYFNRNADRKLSNTFINRFIIGLMILIEYLIRLVITIVLFIIGFIAYLLSISVAFRIAFIILTLSLVITLGYELFG